MIEILDTIKSWFCGIFNDTAADDVTIDIAKANYQKYQDELKQKQKEYIKEVCNAIRIRSREGHTLCVTKSAWDCDYMTNEFLIEMKEYFEQRGFKVEKQGYNADSSDAWLKISWE